MFEIKAKNWMKTVLLSRNRIDCHKLSGARFTHCRFGSNTAKDNQHGYLHTLLR